MVHDNLRRVYADRLHETHAPELRKLGSLAYVPALSKLGVGSARPVTSMIVDPQCRDVHLKIRISRVFFPR